MSHLLIERGAAVLATLAIWPAVTSAEAWCALPQFSVAEQTERVLNSEALVHHLASVPKPLRVQSPGTTRDGIVPLDIAPIPANQLNTSDFTLRRAARISEVFSPEEMRAGHLLVLGGSRRATVPWSTFQRFEDDYWLDLPTAFSLNLIEEVRSHRREIPTEWLRGVTAVVLFGQQRDHTSSLPLCLAMNQILQ